MLGLHDIHISYLPLAHMFERVVQVCVGLYKLCIMMKSHCGVYIVKMTAFLKKKLM